MNRLRPTEELHSTGDERILFNFILLYYFSLCGIAVVFLLIDLFKMVERIIEKLEGTNKRRSSLKKQDFGNL